MILILLSNMLSIMREKSENYKHWIFFFLGKFFFDDDSFQNTLAYQQICSTLELKEDKGTEYSNARKSKELLIKSNLKPLFNLLSHRIKRFRYKVGTQFLNKSFVVENNNYLNKL